MFLPANSTDSCSPSALHFNSTSGQMPSPTTTTPALVTLTTTTDASVQAFTAWWPTANVALGVAGAIAALSLAIYQIRLARRQLHATHGIDNGTPLRALLSIVARWTDIQAESSVSGDGSPMLSA
jgi:hypothetical protein